MNQLFTLLLVSYRSYKLEVRQRLFFATTARPKTRYERQSHARRCSEISLTLVTPSYPSVSPKPFRLNPSDTDPNCSNLHYAQPNLLAVAPM